MPFIIPQKQSVSPSVEFSRQFVNLTIRKRLGLPNKCGWAVPGWSQCGDDNDFTGVYQARKKRIGNWHNWRIGDPKPLTFVMKPTWPTPVYCAANEARRAKLKTALSMWQALTNAEKNVYNDIASRISKRGYDYFMHKTFKSL